MKKLALVLVVCLVGWLVQPAGAVIVQNGTNYVAWEAEYDVTITDADADGLTWQIVDDDISPTGGNVLSGDCFLALYETTNPPSGAKTGDANYTLQFTAAGTYRLYMQAYDHTQDTDLSNNKSVKSTNGVFGAVPSVRFNMYSYNTADTGRPQAQLGGYIWNDNKVIPFATTSSPALYVVTEAMVGQNLSFAFGIRDAGVQVARIALHQVNTMSQSDLSGLNFVPEPATLSLLVLGGLVAMRRRR